MPQEEGEPSPSGQLPGWTTHWLLVRATPSTEELEALLVSRVSQVIRVDEYTLGWEPGVLFRGPLAHDDIADTKATIPDWATAVYAIDTPKQRGSPIPEELQIPGGLIDTFAQAEPIGVERDTLETLDAMARRLGGAVRTDSGELVIAEARADLILFTSTWLKADELTTALSQVADVSLEERPDLPEYIDPGDGYGLVAQLPGGGVLSISASEAQVMPIALAGYAWATGAIYVYEIRHYPAEQFSFLATPRIPRTPAEAEEMVDSQAGSVVESAAQAVFEAAGRLPYGHLCDDDGFLVVL